MTDHQTTQTPPAVQAPARSTTWVPPLKRVKCTTRQAKRVTFKSLQQLRPGQSLTDQAVCGLRWRCVAGKGSSRSAIYAEVRYKDPVTSRRLPRSLGRVPTDEEQALDSISREMV